ncbi:MAG TPA: ATP synthase F1 subunit gamma [Polyangiaceae bacterium]|jgi:F-type H+-transporting ATPase subunit gamma|nr:MAG: ATP synthase gamma chain [Deltaproteobacteria bacterium ADurb.Bin207]HNS96199.1 ATP synthase F1 subunit gamma [Polyangiaceae bacterium]HNZ23077.1 ATP synthase F1 subunit gamma [Polyangiaceae bacterium]HOD21145.1 ATP synthase F1 subunit gamma [Polyangiaceae bacterium]HOE48914.1 ATP synthase F1 subunit gamma [Polyangiaceae bacterium]
MASLKAIRTRIASVKSTQKITRAMKMVAGARLNRAQSRILALRPYAIKTHTVLANCAAMSASQKANATTGENTENPPDSPDLTASADLDSELAHPLLATRPEKNCLFLVLTSDRGLCGAFNSSINRTMEREWHRRENLGQNVQLGLVGRKGRDYFKRRNAPIFKVFQNVWDDLSLDKARLVCQSLIEPFLEGKVDSIYLVYNEFKSAMTQRVVIEPLLPISQERLEDDEEVVTRDLDDFIFEPDRTGLLDRLVPMYVEVSIYRALLESNASEHGARMTAMDAATKNAKEMIAALTLQYNRARQAAITTELGEIIGGAEALKG